MYRCLVSGGCSFAYGFNLRDRNHRYAKILADHMSAELIDVSGAGMSNEFIAAATVSGIIKALESKSYKPEEILVIVGWTSTERFEYFNRHIGRIMSGFMNLTHHVHGDMNQEDRNRSEFMSKHLWDPSYGYYKLIHAFNYLHSFCKAHNVKIIHKGNIIHIKARFPSIKMLNTEVKNSSLIQEALMEEYEEVFNVWSQESTFQEATMKNPLVYTINPRIDTHPSSAGHAMWAQKLIQKHPEFTNV